MLSNEELRERAQLLERIAELEQQINGGDQRSLALATEYLAVLQQIGDLEVEIGYSGQQSIDLSAEHLNNLHAIAELQPT